jgi:hypothetical protein
VTGFFTDTVDFGGGVLTSAGGTDIFVAKFDSSGNHVWSQGFGDPNSQYGRSVTADPSGNVTVTGDFYGTVDFGGGTLTGAGSGIFVAKFGSGGNHVWSQGFGGWGHQYGRSVTTDPSENVIITGDFGGTVDFGGGPLTSSGPSDIVVAKFSPPPCQVLSTRLDFGPVGVGNSKDTTFTIANLNGGTLAGTVSETCPYYSIVSGGGPYTLAPGESLAVTVRYAPSFLGTHACTIETGDALCVDVSCTGVGVAKDMTFTVRNPGGGVLSGAVSETCPNYSIVSGGGSYSLAPGDSLVVTVRFEPTSLGTHICTIETGDALCSDVACTGFAVETIPRRHEMPQQEHVDIPGGFRSSAAIDTFVLAQFEFGSTTGPSPQGWVSVDYSGTGDFAQIYPGVAVTQEDPCLFDPLWLWGFFDDPFVTSYDCHTPNPLPGQGAVPYGTPESGYLWNEIQSPLVGNNGYGDDYRLKFLTYRDLPLDNLVFYVWHVRSWTAGQPGPWRDRGLVYYGGHRDWIDGEYPVGDLIDPGADSIQVALGVRDLCWVWCGTYGAGTCHSHAPLFDRVRLERVGALGPRYGVRHIDLFQDNFAGDGTLTGTARADAAVDILPSSHPGILPGDSVSVSIAPVHAPAGADPDAWLYVRVRNKNDPKSGAGLGSSDTRTGITGPRWPYVGSWTDASSNTWEIFQMDSVITSAGLSVPDRYCVDLNDALFVPGDTVFYFFAAEDAAGHRNYWHRRIAPNPLAWFSPSGQGDDHVTADREEAAVHPCEFTILPAGGFARGGDILYVDDTDDRGGPAQMFFDTSFDMMGLRDRIDRFDVLGPSSAVGNSLASRVKNIQAQIIGVYKNILWNSGTLSSGTIGDGSGNPEKSDDFALLEQFIRTSDKGPGLYISGDNVAEEWVTLSGAAAILLRSDWIPFNLLDGDHTNFGEAVSPLLTGSPDGHFYDGYSGYGERLIAYGSCALVNNFDVLQPTGVSIEEFPYPNAGPGNGAAVISTQTTNAQAAWATVILSGFSYHHIREAAVQYPPARVEHLRTILVYMGNIVPDASGVPGDGPRFANALFNAYPNPFNPETTIKYTIKERAHVSLKIYNVAGQLIRTLVDEVQDPDQIEPVRWDGANNAAQGVSSGVYFYKLVTKNFSRTKKVVHLK